MDIDNSRANAFRKCPDFYKERYINNLEPNKAHIQGALAFGSRVHKLLEERLLTLKGAAYEQSEPLVDTSLEDEAQSMLAAYTAHYPVEPFDVVDVERVFKIPIAGTSHSYIGKLDGVVRYNENAPLYTGKLAILEHKTERRNSLSNKPQAWAARAQVSLYMWACKQLYGEWPHHILLDVLTRQSDKGNIGPSFRRDQLERTEAQSEGALADLTYIADVISILKDVNVLRWPQNTDQCCVGNWKCDFYDLHVVANTPELVALSYKPAEEYLGGL